MVYVHLSMFVQFLLSARVSCKLSGRLKVRYLPCKPFGSFVGRGVSYFHEGVLLFS